MPSADRSLSTATVLRALEESCEVTRDGTMVETVRFADAFPRPRADRVAAGHLVALAAAADGTGVVVWRWFDAVVLERAGADVLLFEPGHGEVRARLRDAALPAPLGSRVHASAGLPGADWWVAGPAASDVELDAVAGLYTEHDLWPTGD